LPLGSGELLRLEPASWLPGAAAMQVLGCRSAGPAIEALSCGSGLAAAGQMEHVA
jgi:hypothetical protein